MRSGYADMEYEAGIGNGNQKQYKTVFSGSCIVLCNFLFYCGIGERSVPYEKTAGHLFIF